MTCRTLSTATGTAPWRSLTQAIRMRFREASGSISSRRSSTSTGRSEFYYVLAPVSHESRPNDVTDMGQPAFKEVQGRVAHLRVVAVTPQRVDGIEETTERIVDLMGHAGSKFAQHGILLLVGKARSKLFALIQRARHCVELIEQQIELTRDSLSLCLRNRVRASGSNALDVSAEYAQRPEHAPERERADCRKPERKTGVYSDERQQHLLAHAEAIRKCRFPPEFGRPKSSPREENAQATPGRLLRRYEARPQSGSAESTSGGIGALHREFHRVRRRKHLPVGKHNDCESNLEPSVMVARAIERVERLPDVGVDGRRKHRGRQPVEIGARQEAKIILLIRLQSSQHDLGNDEGDANQKRRREQAEPSRRAGQLAMCARGLITLAPSRIAIFRACPDRDQGSAFVKPSSPRIARICSAERMRGHVDESRGNRLAKAGSLADFRPTIGGKPNFSDL